MGRKVSKAAGLATRLGASLLLLALAGCSDTLLQAIKLSIERYQQGEVPAAPTPNILSSSHITGHETIVLTFAESMDPSTLVVGGDIGTPDTPVWDTQSFPNDRATLSRSVHWDAGVSRTLIVDCRNAAGAAMNTYTLTYTVFHGVCVHPSGLDTNEGTTLAPRFKIDSGIAKVQSEYGSGEVRVATGTYAGASPVVTMVEGISLYGGYPATSWSTRDTVTHPSTIEDTSTSGGTSMANANRAVSCDTGITGVTILDGFTIKLGAVNGHNTSVFCSGSPTIQNCTIQGRTSGNGASVYGIMCRGSATIRYNTINPDKGITESYGIYIEACAPAIDYNTINGGSGPTSCGIASTLSGTSPQISHNTIDRGTGTSAYCILSWDSHPGITDNTLHLSAGYGIYEFDNTSNPASVRRNDFYEAAGIWYHDATLGDVRYDDWESKQVSTEEGPDFLCNPTWANYSTGHGVP